MASTDLPQDARIWHAHPRARPVTPFQRYPASYPAQAAFQETYVALGPLGSTADARYGVCGPDPERQQSACAHASTARRLILTVFRFPLGPGYSSCSSCCAGRDSGRSKAFLWSLRPLDRPAPRRPAPRNKAGRQSSLLASPPTVLAPYYKLFSKGLLEHSGMPAGPCSAPCNVGPKEEVPRTS